MVAFCDADWASCLLSRKSVIGYMVKVCQSSVSWKAKKHTTTSKILVEAKYKSLSSTFQINVVY